MDEEYDVIVLGTGLKVSVEGAAEGVGTAEIVCGPPYCHCGGGSGA